MDVHKYRPYATVELPDRTWPDVVLDRAPIWCSTDLRDGNQALVNPMDGPRKRRFFELLVRLGVKEIEVGFPSASKPDFDFCRVARRGRADPGRHDDRGAHPGSAGADRAHVRGDRGRETRDRPSLQLDLGDAAPRRLPARPRRDHRARRARAPSSARRWPRGTDTEVVFQYSPESFHHTELDYALEICEAVAEEWGPTPDEKMIVNLPTTVEAFPPNVYADRMEWFARHFTRRESAILSVHPHNDRGTAVATAELGLMAGAERVEGCLFGNGERTGNVDLITLALNLFTQGVDPGLDLSELDEARAIVEQCNELPVHPRHPYVGELVYTAFSGSHQDAIKKGMDAQERAGSAAWDVPYLPIDPQDVGRDYEAIIRVNSQSGKGGVAYLMKTEHHLDLPRGLQVDFARKVQAITDARGGELTAAELMSAFTEHYLDVTAPYAIVSYTHESSDEGDRLTARMLIEGDEEEVVGEGNGPIAALVHGLERRLGIEVDVRDYHEHAMSAGEDATAAAYVEVDVDEDVVWGVGIHPSIVTASLERSSTPRTARMLSAWRARR